MRIFQLFLSNNSIILLSILFFFFFYLEQFLTKSYPITREHNKRGQFLFLQKNTFESILPRNKASSNPSPRFYMGHPVYERERENGFCPWTGRGRVIVRIFRQVCVARGLCVEKILTVGAVLFAPSKKRERGDIDSKEIVECFSNLSLPWPGPHSLTVNCV